MEEEAPPYGEKVSEYIMKLSEVEGVSCIDPQIGLPIHLFTCFIIWLYEFDL